MKILTKRELQECLYNYYMQNYGESSTDIWYEQSAINVLVFCRDKKVITLKSHILTGDVSEFIEELKVNDNDL